jgi:D-lactate dehydrogenase
MAMKIAFFEISGEETKAFAGAFKEEEVVFSEEKLDENNIEKAKDADAVCIFTGSSLNKGVMDALPNLKFIATRSTGFNQIDCEYAKQKGIKVSSVPAYGSDTVAEFTFALILTLSRKMREASKALKEDGDFSVPESVQGFDLANKTLGVVGTGKIGKNVIQIARGFDMNVLAYDLHPDLEFAKEQNFTYKSFDEVISGSDILTMHAPSTKENFHLINKENISKMKKGAYLINTARGDLVDTQALTQALKDGVIAGAGLDVLEGEGEFKKGEAIPMLDMPNVVMTPHMAFDTKEAKERIIHTTIINIKNFLSGTPVNVVN